MRVKLENGFTGEAYGLIFTKGVSSDFKDNYLCERLISRGYLKVETEKDKKVETKKVKKSNTEQQTDGQQTDGQQTDGQQTDGQQIDGQQTAVTE